MAQQNLNLGVADNDGLGDSLKAGGTKIQANFTDLYTNKLNTSAIGVSVQAFDADLSAIAALTGTNTIYYRSAASTWTAVTTGGGVTFSGGVISLGAITPTSVAASGTVAGSNLSGTNTGDQTSVSGNAGTATALATGRTLAITGDLTWTSPTFNGSSNVTAAGTLATVNSNVGSFGSSTLVPVVTLNAKGLVTACTTATITRAALATYLDVMPSYKAGNYIWSKRDVNANTSSVIGLNLMRATIIVVTQTITISELFTRISTAAASGNVQLAIYATDASGTVPSGNPIAKTGNISTTSAAMVNATVNSGTPVQLPAGIYFIAVMCDNATAAIPCFIGGTAGLTAYVGSATLANLSSASGSNFLSLQWSVTFGTWPNATTTPGTETAIQEPFIGFKVSSVP